MSEDGLTNEDFDLDLTQILEDEDDGVDYNNLPPEPKLDNKAMQEVGQYKQKVATLEEELGKIRQHLETGKKTNFLDQIFSKYANLDDDFKHMVAEVLHGYNQMTQSELKPIYKYFDTIQEELNKTKIDINKATEYIGNVQSDIAFDKLVRQYLQRGLKKNTVTEDVIIAAKKLHQKKLQKDESYYLKLDNIITRNSITDAQKDKLIGQLILDSFLDDVKSRAAKGKLKEGDPELKKRVDKDPDVEKAQKKVDKENKREESEEKEGPPELTEAQRAANREAIQKRFRQLKNL